MSKRVLSMMVVAVLLLVMGTARADLTQTANLNMTSGGNDLLPGTGIYFSSYVWTGTDNLDMNGKYIKNTVDANGFTLDLAGHLLKGSGVLTTTQTGGANAGSITINNASGITVDTVSASSTFGGGYYGNAGAFNVSQTGAFSASAIDTHSTAATGGAVTCVGDGTGGFTVTTGGIRTDSTVNNQGPAGQLVVYGYNGFSVTGGINTSGGKAGNVYIGHTGSAIDRIGGAVSVTGGIDSKKEGAAGATVKVFATGDISVAGGIDIRSTYTGGYVGPGSVVMDTTGGSISLTGDVLSTTRYRSGGSVTLSATGDITVDGTMDLNGAGTYPDGYMDLTASGTSSTITIGNSLAPGASVLDLDKVGYVLFDSGSGVSYIYADIDNFVPGSPASTQLRVANDGDIVYYSHTANPDLGGVTYTIQSMGGGVGYLQSDYTPPVAEPAGLGLLGLALLGLRKRRS